MSHNGTGYSEDMNPDMIDGVHAERDQWARERGPRPTSGSHRPSTRPPPHRLSPRLRQSRRHALDNFYGNWIPIQEMSDWFEHWATTGIKPLFTCEYSVPFMWDWAMYRGWYKGKREFGSAVVPGNLASPNGMRSFSATAPIRSPSEEKAVLRWESAKFKKGQGWFRWDSPQSLNSQVFEDRYRVIAMYLTDNWRAFRTWGMSANSPWDYGSYWNHPEHEPTDLTLAVDWDHLQRPGPRAAYVDEAQAREQLAFHASDYQPTLAAQALYRNNMPLLGYIGGKTAAFTSKDHNFLPGETVEKQLIVINNSRLPVKCAASWSFRSADRAGGSAVVIPTGEQQRIPLKFTLPTDLSPGRYDLSATFHFSTGEIQVDSFAIDVMPALPPTNSSASIALFDPRGETSHLLDALAIRYHPVEAAADLSSYDALIVGKGALTPYDPAPDITRVRDGLKVIVFEQTGEVLEKRLGFRIAEYGLRQVFKRIPDHPLLTGLSEDNLTNWRGASTTLPPRLTYTKPAMFNNTPTVEWAGLPETRVWRNGNRGNVASALIEKPAHGDFLPILDGGYSLQYASLLEHREGRH